jgi:hypothetical protein
MNWKRLLPLSVSVTLVCRPRSIWQPAPYSAATAATARSGLDLAMSHHGTAL